MRLFVLPCAVALIGLSISADAQTLLTEPTITVEPVSVAERPINIERLADDTLFSRSWTAVVTDNVSYQFELTYDGERTTTTSTIGFVDLETGDSEGTVVSGQRHTFEVRANSILKGRTGGDGERKLVLHVFRQGERGEPASSAVHVFSFSFDLEAPPPPKITNVGRGENRLELTWTAPTLKSGEKIATYEIFYHANVLAGPCEARVGSTTAELGISSTVAAQLIAGEASFPFSETGIGSTVTNFSVSDSLVNELCAMGTLRSVDDAGNEGSFGNFAVATPTNVFDFFELHRSLAGPGAEDGGFCFIATAAHGSYAHPVVRLLRNFRDGILKRTPVGTALVWLYYRLSPPIAARVAANSETASVVRLGLIPVAVLAAAWMLAPLGGLCVLAWFFWRRRRGRRLVAVLPAVALAFWMSPAQAEIVPVEDEGMGWGLFFRGGPYLPDMAIVDGEGTSNSSPRDLAFTLVFSDNVETQAAPNPLYWLGVDLHLYSGVGSAGIGGAFGFLQFVGKALEEPTDDSPRSGDTTVFNILPLELVGFYRFDWFDKRYGVPFVPYARGGVAYYIWWVTTGVGDVSRVTESSGDFVGRGGKFGLTGTLGLAFVLDSIEPRAAAKLQGSTGIRSTSIFGEVQASKVNSFDDNGFDLSEVNWNLGLYLEF